MSEKDFIEAIRKERKDAIARADKKYAQQFLQPKMPRKTLIIALTIIILYLITSTALIFREPPVQQTINNIQEITEVNVHNNVTEHIIKGDKQMVCIGSPNSTKMTCYKEVE